MTDPTRATKNWPNPTRVKKFWPGPITTKFSVWVYLFMRINDWNKNQIKPCPFKVEMGPDPTWAYFWPAVIKRLTQLRPGYFSTRPEETFFDPKGKKLKKLTFLGEIFQTQTQTINGWPDLSHKKLTWPDPGENFLTQTHHYF